jgi:hypothetical protein
MRTIEAVFVFYSSAYFCLQNYFIDVNFIWCLVSTQIITKGI